MIIVEPPAARFEVGDASTSDQEHLLERISALENRLSRMTERLERGLDLLLRQAQNSYFDRALIKALVALLSEDGIVEGARLERLWNDRCQKDAEEQEESARREEVRTKILASYKGAERSAFEQFINEGFLFIEDQQLARGIRSLQKAIELAGDNARLLCFVGEHFFRTGKTRRANQYLTRAHELAPADVRVSLLLGLTCADEGETERAKDLLNSATRLGGPSFAAHYGLGRLFVAENNWQKALLEFKRALATKPSPEAHYALGCLYYQLNRDSLAIRHLRKATELDGSYSEAFYLLGLLYQRSEQELPARDAFEKAAAAEKLNTPTSKRRLVDDMAVAPLFRASNSTKLITGSDRRIAAALREDALSAFAKSDSN
jgi:tetratricopeptide (TPR) repeat protein